MPESEGNPYESPQADLTPPQRGARHLSKWIAVPVTLLAMTIAFCGACYPTAIIIGGFGYGISMGGGPSPESAWYWLLEYFWAFLIVVSSATGGVVAWIVGRRLWAWMRTPREPQ